MPRDEQDSQRQGAVYTEQGSREVNYILAKGLAEALKGILIILKSLAKSSETVNMFRHLVSWKFFQMRTFYCILF